MEPELNYEEAAEQINEMTARVLKQYEIDEDIKLPLPEDDDNQAITQKIFLKAFHNLVNTLMKAIQKKTKITVIEKEIEEEEEEEEDSTIQLNQKRIKIESLYKKFTESNQRLYDLIFKENSMMKKSLIQMQMQKKDKDKAKSIENRRYLNDHNEDDDSFNQIGKEYQYSTPLKQSTDLQRKNCKIGLESFEGNSNKKSIYYSAMSSNKKGRRNEYDCSINYNNDNNRRDNNHFNNSKQNSTMYSQMNNLNNNSNPNISNSKISFEDPILNAIIIIIILFTVFKLISFI